ncbi:MAG: tRNA threonylcarbamoyladenosine dehydratase [Clostridia bacterium]|nr:tRNA threonylcarbamoyladenosine dehydratase [Clostridia bacterium]
MPDQFSRTQRLLGQAAMARLAGCRVAVFGIGGVGGHVCEALVRSGVGAFDLVDDDRVSLSNLNRQIIATHSTLGLYKVDVMRRRMLEINPRADIAVHRCFVLPENVDGFPFDTYDYLVDAVDTVSAKLCLIQRAQTLGVPVISAMGAGNKLDPGRFRVSDITLTHTCPLARVMRRELKKRGIPHLMVVWSDEAPLLPIEAEDNGPTEAEPAHPGRRAIPGSTAFVPAVAGLMIAGEVVRDLTKDCPRQA